MAAILISKDFIQVKVIMVAADVVLLETPYFPIFLN
jgi:hypothetical protein